MSLQILGSIYTIAKPNLIVVKIENPGRIPRIGVDVIDENNEYIGRVVDIIGPVESPFAVLRPAKQSVISNLKPSTILFYKSKKIEKKGKMYR